MITANPTRKQLSAVIGLTLALVTAALYWPMLHHQFINVDDEQYITSNPHVQAGFTWRRGIAGTSYVCIRGYRKQSRPA